VGRVEIVLVSVQDRCIVCAKRTIGLEIVLDKRDGSPMEAHFSSFGDCSNLYSRDRCPVCAERTVSLEIILDAPDRTPR
jgi:hypothetical protein